jgi:hypothetical protein
MLRTVILQKSCVRCQAVGPFSEDLRCLVGGAIVDDIDYYNRVHEMLHILTSEQNRNNDDIEGFGYR